TKLNSIAPRPTHTPPQVPPAGPPVPPPPRKGGVSRPPAAADSGQRHDSLHGPVQRIVSPHPLGMQEGASGGTDSLQGFTTHPCRGLAGPVICQAATGSARPSPWARAPHPVRASLGPACPPRP